MLTQVLISVNSRYGLSVMVLLATFLTAKRIP